MAENEKETADLKNPPTLITTVPPDETPGREDEGYVGVAPEYTTAASEQYAPVPIERGTGSGSSSGDEKTATEIARGSVATPNKAQEEVDKEATSTVTTPNEGDDAAGAKTPEGDSKVVRSTTSTGDTEAKDKAKSPTPPGTTSK